MPYALRTFTCIDCGGPARRRRPAGSDQRCTACAVEYAAECARQLHARSGPIYMRWLWAEATYFGRTAKRLTQVKQGRAA